MPADPDLVRQRIVVDPAIHHGAPVVRGTRVPVAVIVDGLAGGMSPDEIAREYGVTAEDIRAAVEFARRRKQ